ncbi:MAG TPA: hypothetical protein ENI95_13545 [Chloroflexi bacterium]|nr:hypothetical protein [Chloroflexota bacterium]
MNQPEQKTDLFSRIMRMIFSVEEEDEIGCDECYEHIDQYVDMLRAGQNPDVVLPQVKRHLEQCRCCEVEFQALITILETGIESENGASS